MNEHQLVLIFHLNIHRATEKYTRGVSAVESILTLDSLRQSVAIKELEQTQGQPLSMRKTVSVPNFSQVSASIMWPSPHHRSNALTEYKRTDAFTAFAPNIYEINFSQFSCRHSNTRKLIYIYSLIISCSFHKQKTNMFRLFLSFFPRYLLLLLSVFAQKHSTLPHRAHQNYTFAANNTNHQITTKPKNKNVNCKKKTKTKKQAVKDTTYNNISVSISG